MIARAFLLEPVSYDVSHARQYGAPAYVFSHGENRPAILSDEFPSAVIESLERQSFDPKLDCFIVTGGLVPIARALTAMTERYGQVKMLLFNAAEKSRNPYFMRMSGGKHHVS